MNGFFQKDVISIRDLGKKDLDSIFSATEKIISLPYADWTTLPFNATLKCNSSIERSASVVVIHGPQALEFAKFFPA